MDDRRPNPDDLLARANTEDEKARRGRLKLFFGAAPGVGKTFAMLQEARAGKASGRDVVVGWVETHGRDETAKLLEGLERLPPRRIPYRGLDLAEFDADAAVRRRPELLLVDELAHTNAPGSRHRRRWQDVFDLLDAGIDVATTLNVQHVESLNDVVFEVTGVTVRETVPDLVIDRADEIEFVDCGPDELLKRLHEGRVYAPAEARRAIDHFFRKGNLIALRELALRRTAERVDIDAAAWKREHGERTPLRIRDRLLVAVGPAPKSADLVRATARMAQRLRAPWIALSAETLASERWPARERDRVAEHLLAERLGGEVLVVRGDRVADEILRIARERDVTRVIVGRPTHPRRLDLFRGSVVDELVRRGGDIEILVTSGDEERPRTEAPRRANLTVRVSEIALVSVVVAAVTGLAKAASGHVALADIAMLYLVGVVLVAARSGRIASLFAAVASVVTLNFFFVPPFFSFAVADTKHLLTFALLLVAGVGVSALTQRLRSLAESARERERRTTALYTASRELAAAPDTAAIAAVATARIGELFAAETVVLLADETLLVGSSPASDSRPDGKELEVARWVSAHGRAAGRGTDTLPSADHLFLPIAGPSGPLGVFGIDLARRQEPLAPSQRQLLETMVAQIAMALERARLSAEARASELAAETERTRNVLLASISHDLRTPLAALRGTTELLADSARLPDEAARRGLLTTLREETERLHRLVEDVLDLTRIESGALRAQKEWCPLEEIVAAAAQQARARFGDHHLVLELPPEVLLVEVDARLFAQVFFNLLENAAKFSPPGTTVTLRARRAAEIVEIEVLDQGSGIPEDSLDRIFERFYRAPDGRRTEGTGLGLAICRAIVKAHGGTIVAENRAGGGARFRVTLPTRQPPAVAE